VLIGNGNGTFTVGGAFPVGAGPLALAVGDFNGDASRPGVGNDRQQRSIGILIGQRRHVRERPTVNAATRRWPSQWATSTATACRIS